MAWPVAGDAGTLVRACIQLVDVLSQKIDGVPPADRFTALRRLVQLRSLLDADQRRRLSKGARSLGVGERVERFLAVAPRRTQIKDVDAREGTASYADDNKARDPSPAPRSAPEETPATVSPAIGEAVSNVSELIRRIERSKAASGAARSVGEDVAWSSDARGLITLGGAAFGDAQKYRLGTLEYAQPEIMNRLLRRCAPFRNQRVARPGSGYLLLSGSPKFDPDTGAFLGYRGRVRGDGEVALLGVPSDTVAEVAHEVRTPLNAILGYAEMIDREVLGPAPESHRRGARAIIMDAQRLLAAVDALGDAAALEDGRDDVSVGVTTHKELIDRLTEDFAPLALERGVRLSFEAPANASPLHAEPTTLYRAVSRLLTAILAFSDNNATIRISGGQGSLSISMPRALINIGERALLTDRISAPEDADPPLLGLAFTLRILKRLAAVNGGRFVISDTAFEMNLPPVRPQFDAEVS
ncbi:sensor histidine kinase [Pacificimonas sp. ICDLI1SI03]